MFHNRQVYKDLALAIVLQQRSLLVICFDGELERFDTMPKRSHYMYLFLYLRQLIDNSTVQVPQCKYSKSIKLVKSLSYQFVYHIHFHI